MNVRSPGKTIAERIYWIDYLRSLNIIATVVFHSLLAYSPYLKNFDESIKSSFPMLDPNTSLRSADLMLLLRPLFSMPLMFYLSGIFVWSGIQKRGSIGYLKNRFKRLIIPLILATILVMPLTFAPLELMIHGDYYPASIKQLSSILLPNDYKLAHLWFLWVLFLFDCIATGVRMLCGSWLEEQWKTISNPIFYGVLATILSITYMLMANIGGKFGWLTIIGLLDVPASRIGLYLIYFSTGVLMGSLAIHNDAVKDNIFSVTGTSKNYISVGICAIATGLVLVYAQTNIDQVINFIGAKTTIMIINGLYSISGLVMVMALILLAKKHLNQRSEWLDLLNKDAYGIYIIHYMFVAWLQFLLIDKNLPGEYKPIITALISIPLSWLIANGSRKIAKYWSSNERAQNTTKI